MVKLQVAEGGPIQSVFELWSIHGFSASNIFAAGSKKGSVSGDFLALLIHYDGQQWKEIPVDGKELYGVWGLSDTDIWVGGLNGTLMHYNGTNWTKFSMPDSIWISDIAGFATDDVYAVAYHARTWTMYMYHWDGQSWRLQDRFRPDVEFETFGSHRLRIIDDELYSVGYGGAYHKSVNDSVWDRIVYSPLLFDICGSSRQNLIVAGSGGVASHFNGKNWLMYQDIYLSYFENTACWTDGREAIITSDNGLFTYVFHGK
jgi:hypothetical protein